MNVLVGTLAVASDLVLLGAVVLILSGSLKVGSDGWVVVYWILVPFLLGPLIPAFTSWARWDEFTPIERLRMNLPFIVASFLVGVILWAAL